MIKNILIGYGPILTALLLSSFAMSQSTASQTVVATASGTASDGSSDEKNIDSLEASIPFNEIILLSVNKATMRAELKTWPLNSKDSRVLKSYQFAMGKEKGDKEREGDHKTPEGIYFPQKHIPGSKLLQTKYGPRAIPLDFPNPIDRLDGKTGYGIWLHGAGNDERIAKTNVTEGCIAFYNKDITKISSWLEPYQALVVIAEDSSQVNKEDEIAAVRMKTNAWIDAWKSRNVDDYISFYSDKFKLKGRKRQSYRSHKSRIFSSYKVMTVGISELRIVTHPKYAVAIMNQDFDGDGWFISNGRKVLFWTKNPQGEWEITRELFHSRRLVPVAFGPKEIELLKDESATTSPKQVSLPVSAKL